MNDLISIIIPCYNIAPHIERCLKSVTNQTCRNLEIIVLNDGSTDGTSKIIDTMAKEDKRLVVIHKENTGVSDTRNKGLDIAKGDYIGLVDGDDELYPDMIALLLNNAKNHDADISHCGFELVNPNKIIPINGTGLKLVQDRNEALESLLKGKFFEPSTCNKLYRRDILEGVRYPVDIRINEDLVFNVAAFKNCKRSVFEDVVKYRYIYNASSASRSDRTLYKAENVMLAAKRIKDMLSDSSLDEAVYRFYANKLVNTFRSLRQRKLLETDLGIQVKSELTRLNPSMLDSREYILRALLIHAPWIYDLLRLPYDLLFKARHKWRIQEHV